MQWNEKRINYVTKENKIKIDTSSKEKNIILETIRKSKLAASNEFEIKRLSRPQDSFLPCSIEEERESLVIRFDVHNVLSWLNIRRENEKRELMIPALIDYYLCRLSKAAERRLAMNDKSIWRRIKPLPLVVLIIGSIGFIWTIINLNAFKMEQNIYFIESVGTDTVIFKYDDVRVKRPSHKLISVP